MTNRTTRVALVTVSAAALLLAGCSSTDEESAQSSGTSAVTSTTAEEGSASATTEASESSSGTTAEKGAENDMIHLHDAYVKGAVEGTKMTAVFGLLHNHTDKDVTVESFDTSLGEDLTYELHEVKDGVMQEKEGGIVIPADGSVELKPGGEHLMIMGLTKPINAGETIDVNLYLSDGTVAHIKDIPARTIASGEENYGGDHFSHSGSDMKMENMPQHSDMPGMDHDHAHDHDHK